MIRSRLRRPTSKSITATFLPWRARPQAMLALVVVLPTPPLPEVTTMISAKCWSSVLLWVPTSWASVELFDAERFAVQPDLHRLAVQFLRDVLQHLVVAGDGDQFGVEFAAEDACLRIALGAGEGAAAEGTVDVDGAVGDDFGAGADGGEHGEVAVVGVDLLAGAHGRGVHQAGFAARGRGLWRGFAGVLFRARRGRGFGCGFGRRGALVL